MAGKNILLIEPSYRNKYPPLGLMKIAQYHGAQGKKDNVRFIKGEDKSALGQAWDRIYVTTLFSFEWERIAKSINFALELVHGQASKVFVGGIAASLMHEAFLEQHGWRGIRFIKGLLKDAPAVSLGLDDFDDDLYADDTSGPPIEDLVPDYSILSHISYKYPVSDAHFTYASRGCVRSCKFCGVPSLEGAQRDTYSVAETVKGTARLYGEKKDLILMDNNVVASANFKDIIATIVDLGFHKGATIQRGRTSVLRRVDFNQGVDARILCRDPMYMRELSKIAIKPLRVAFDHLGLKKPYSQAIHYAAEVGITDLSNYMLYNFHDGPEDLFERMRLNVTLNEALNIRIFSFPMRYQPVTRKDRGHIGANWNRYYLRSMQIILQATHGIVSGAPQFFRKAFGDTYDEYKAILVRPHHYIFNRSWYEDFDGKPEMEEYTSTYGRLSISEQGELLDFLCQHDQWEYERNLSVLPKNVRQAARFYIPLGRQEEIKIWAAQKKRRDSEPVEVVSVPDDERVEDADLTSDEFGNRPSHAENMREVA